ncbi:MAG: hypothetical protein ABI835_14965, partial [Chloroflexota bacterium]
SGAAASAGGQMNYLRVNARRETELVLADVYGDNPQLYASGDVTNLRWIDVRRFVYQQDGILWIGMEGYPSSSLLEPAPDRVVFLADGTFVYSSAGSLWRGSLSSGGTQLSEIASVADGALFDALLAP